ncbi:MAG: T9SS type A sorting domain-containing protein [Flavobacteriales bacterium]|nr:T9SS type A sorting domain-containing protein [Flavobacteriales bacterium]
MNLNRDKEIVSIAVYNLLGKQVLNKTISTNETQVNLEHLPKGMYVINVVFNEGSLSKKIILE